MRFLTSQKCGKINVCLQISEGLLALIQFYNIKLSSIASQPSTTMIQRNTKTKTN